MKPARSGCSLPLWSTVWAVAAGGGQNRMDGWPAPAAPFNRRAGPGRGREKKKKTSRSAPQQCRSSARQGRVNGRDALPEQGGLYDVGTFPVSLLLPLREKLFGSRSLITLPRLSCGLLGGMGGTKLCTAHVSDDHQCDTASSAKQCTAKE